MYYKYILQYVHDGSDTLADSVLVVGRTAGVEWPDKDRTSVPATLDIIINPVNDATPRLVNNTGLTLWAGSTVNLTSIHLAAVDQDTRYAEL